MSSARCWMDIWMDIVSVAMTLVKEDSIRQFKTTKKLNYYKHRTLVNKNVCVDVFSTQADFHITLFDGIRRTNVFYYIVDLLSASVCHYWWYVKRILIIVFLLLLIVVQYKLYRLQRSQM